ncbi:SDR family oxidoreductase [Mycolicibacter terrae]|uniref:Dehydrogenase n=2 Tax=Mycolicibacter TaxID=1073531 RepID=A0A1A2P1F7_MYCSD|nr:MULTISPECIES: SDR family oxidoreductase [Mycolicibacter]OBH21157.1 dehydrogenase [Mycolicibacter sinensis]OBI25733.1 dehydrogenase [Mycolicibacter sinensis]RRR43024.1 SDR family oxidoreductase [Mycolicibacter terrae]
MRLDGRAAVVTGGSQGLGLAVARAFAAEGADVLICGRGEEALENARASLSAGTGCRVLAAVADVSRPDDAERLVSAALNAFGRLDVLVNNAGVYGPMGLLEDVDWGEWARAVEINLLGTVLPCRAALPHMKSAGRGKIVNLSGGGATAPMPRISAYAASKAAVVRFTETLAEEVRQEGIDVNAVAPGALNTRLLEQVLSAGADKVGADYYRKSVKQKEEGGASMDRAAALCVFLASAASDGLTGKLISAVWDPWDTLPAHAAVLGESDIYTLRRIVPQDRGEDWG